MFERALSFAALVVVLTAIPGPAVVLIMKSSVLHGRRSAVTTALGVFSGDMIWVTASLTGLTAILVAYRPAFEGLRFAGAAYLVYPGLRLLFRRDGSAAGSEISPRTAGRTGRKAFGEGALCELSNPKTLIVFTGVIPPFMSSSLGVAELAVFGGALAIEGLRSV
ncbi:MAG: LysE family translocator [Antricoccus sp.]